MFGWLGTLRLIPVIGGLFFSPFKAHIEAFKESFLAILFSGFPIIIPMIGATFQPSFPVQDYLNKLIGEGELFLYASAFVGPLIYAVIKSRKVEAAGPDPNRTKTTLEFPYAYSFIIISFLICIASVVAYVSIRLSPHGEHVDETQRHAVFNASLWIYAVSIICLYSSTVYRNVLEDVEHASEVMRDDERSFIDKWQNKDG